jgi:predicted transcriptional regulator
MRWTDKEINYLKDNALKMMQKEIAEHLNKTEGAVRNKCWRLGLVNKENFWTEEEIKSLEIAYKQAGESGVINLTEIADKMNRDKSNVCRKAKELGLTTNKNRIKKESKKTRSPKYSSNEARKKAISESLKKWHKEHEHPKGMLGKHHSKEYCNELSRRIKGDWERMTPEKLEQRRLKSLKTKTENGTLNSAMNRENPYSRARGGKREDLNNIYFRSSWEANMARYYNFVGIEWEFEPKTFVFTNITRGSVSYTPDFYLPKEDRWVEVKGWMDSKSKTKLKRFQKQYPDEYAKLEIITGKEYKEFAKYKRLIPGWEDVHVGV